MKGQYKGASTLTANLRMLRASDEECEAMAQQFGEHSAYPWELVQRHSPQRPLLPHLALQRTTGPLSHPEDAQPEMRAMRAKRAARSGLVSLSTSGTRHEISPIDVRLTGLRKRVRWVGNYYRDCNAGKPAMLTLTYAKEDAWDARHVSECLRHIRQHLKRKGHTLRYVWVAELQQRGAVHFHVVIWLPRGITLPKPDKQGWWKHGSTNIKWATKAVGYLMKYVSKLTSKGGGFPKGLRLHGAGGLESAVRATRTWRFLPTWLHVLVSPECKVTRAKGGGWVSRATGELFESPYIMTGFSFVPGVGRVVHITRREGEVPC